MGKTLIDLDLRNDLLDFVESIKNNETNIFQMNASELYWRLKPKRTHVRKLEDANDNDLDFSGPFVSPQVDD